MLIQNKRPKLKIQYKRKGEFILGLFIIGLILFYLPNTASAAWMDAKWLYRAAVPITAHTAAETNVYTTITIDTATPITAGKMQADCGDIRVAKFNGATLPYFINASPGCNNVATTIQVYFTSFPAGAQTIYYYYGNPTTYNGFKNSAFSTAATGETIGTVGSEEQSAYPVGYWKFDDGQGTSAQDASPNNLDGTITGTSWQPEDRCVAGKCLYFSASGDNKVVIANTTNRIIPASNAAFTISLYFKTTGLSSGNIYSLMFNETYPTSGFRFGIDTGNGYNCGSASSYKPFFWSSESGGSIDLCSNTAITDGSWNHIAIVYAGSSAKMYLNGKEVASDSSGSVVSNTNNIAIADGIGGKLEFKGMIDEPKIYNYARTAAQIRADYNAGKNNATAHSGSSAVMGAKTQDYLSNGLVGYWKLDESSGDAADSSGNSLTLTNNSSMAYGAGKFGNAATGDGTADFLNTTTTISSVQTIAFWVNPANSTDNYINLTGSTVYINSSSGTVSATGVTSPSIYVNGVLNGTVTASTWNHITITTASAISASQFEVGRANSAYAVSGSKFDDVRIYSRALSPKEISDLYSWAPGPVGYWDFEEGGNIGVGSTAADRSGNNNAGIWSGTGTRHSDTGKYGKAGKFNGSDDYVSITHNAIFNLPYQITVGAWIYIKSYANSSIVSKGDLDNHPIPWQLDINTAGKVNFYQTQSAAFQTQILGTTVLSKNTWYYITATNDGITAKLYINGVLEGSDSTPATNVTTDSENIGIGGATVGNVYTFDGSIDDVKIYNYARTQKQIVSDMQGGNPSAGSGPRSGAIAHYRFDEGQGTTANNSGSGGSALNGSISGASWSHSGKFGRALSFDGNNDDINAGSNAAVDNLMNNDATFSTWINPDVCNGIRDVLGKNGGAARGWYFFASTSNCDPKLIVYYDSGVNSAAYQASTGSVATGTWQQLTAVWTANTKSAKLYVNGKEVSYATQTAGTGTYDADASYNLAIGNYSPGAADTRLFDGLLDDVKIYPYALTADEVKTDYNKGQSAQLSAAGNNTTYAAGAANQEYCVPGDASTCSAPVGRWDFEEGNGASANDTSGNANTGTITGAAWKSGKVGKALNFDGTDDHVANGSGSSLGLWSTDFTMEAWVNPKSIPGSYETRGIIGADTNGPEFHLFKSGSSLYPRIGKSGVSGATMGGTAVPLNQWSHVAVTFNNTSKAVTYYVNGVSSTITYSVTFSDGLSNLIGAASPYDFNNYLFHGPIDQVRIFNYARSAAQVAYDYNRGAPVGWWKMDECQGGTIYDSSGNRNNGTITIGSSGTQTGNGTCVDGMSTSTWANGATGKRNSSLNFDGTDDYVDLGTLSNVNLNSAFTVSGWMYYTSANIDKSIFGSSATGEGRRIALRSNAFTIQPDGAGFTENVISSVSANTWHQLTGVYDGTQIKLYVDGILKDTDAVTGSLDASPTSYYIGSLPGTGWYMGGQIDDVRVYNYALTATQVKDLYTNGSATFAPSTGTP